MRGSVAGGRAQPRPQAAAGWRRLPAARCAAAPVVQATSKCMAAARPPPPVACSSSSTAAAAARAACPVGPRLLVKPRQQQPGRAQPCLQAAPGWWRLPAARCAAAPVVQATSKCMAAARPPPPVACSSSSTAAAAARAACPVGPRLLVKPRQQQPGRRRRQEGFEVVPAAASDGRESEGPEDERDRPEEIARESYVVGDSRGEEAPRTTECTDEMLLYESIVLPEPDSEKCTTGAAVAGGGGVAGQLADKEMCGTGAEAVGGGGTASGLQPAAAAPLPPSGAAAPAGSQKPVPTISDVLEAIAGAETRLRKEIKTGADVQGAMAERLVLLEREVTGVDKQARPSQLLTSGDDLLRICRWFDLPASKERLLKALLDKQHSAYHSLQGLVLQQMQAEAAKHGVQLPMFPERVDCWKEEQERWQQARTDVLAARQKLRTTRQEASGKVAWLPFLKGLQSYASAASRRRLPSHLRDPKHGKLVLMLVAAHAAKRLLDELEFDAAPVLERRPTEEGAALELDLVEVKTNPDAISKAVRQLVVQARILVFVLATTNAQLLKALGPLKVVGTEVVGRPLSSEQQRFWASRQLDVSCSAAPETASLQMRLRLRP